MDRLKLPNQLQKKIDLSEWLLVLHIQMLKMKKLRLLLPIYLLTFFKAFCDNVPPGFPSGDIEPIPIDGGLTFLLISGGTYGYFRLRGKGKLNRFGNQSATGKKQ